jgi:pheromone shutdown protein TraB
MARKLKRLMSEHPDKKILAVMGAGHEDAVLEILRESEAITYSFGIGK